ncbi:MAG: cation:proton antiporter [Candidatus Diapherotrites archaeon]|nr:cation:proton antiporter [Candidatus Diapherotrites archaeon]
MVEFVISLIVLLVGAKLLGEVAERVGLPSVIGYIFAGIAAGPMLLGISAPGDVSAFAELGIILMLFVTGFEQGNIAELMKNFRAIFTVSTMGYFIPYAAVMAVAMGFGFGFNQALLLGLIMSATDSGITLKSINSVGKLGTRAGKTMIGVTVMDGTMGLVIFTGVMAYLAVGALDFVQIGSVVLSILAFLVVFLIIQKLVPILMDQVEHLTVEQAEFSFAFIFMILLALVAETFGLHGIIGAFLAGTVLARSPIAGTNFIERVSSISYAIFVPLFFVWTGLLLNLQSLTLLAFAVTGAVLIANAIGAYFAGKLSGFSTQENLLLSISMLPRGDINLILVSIGITMVGMNGQLIVTPAIGQEMFSAVMFLVLFGALITAVMLKIFIKKEAQ